MTYLMKPLGCDDPARIKGVSERLTAAHCAVYLNGRITAWKKAGEPVPMKLAAASFFQHKAGDQP
jgi:hypothetical protein